MPELSTFEGTGCIDARALCPRRADGLADSGPRKAFPSLARGALPEYLNMNTELPPTPTSNGSSSFQRGWNRIRSNKTVFFALTGFLGGFLGDLVTEPFAARDSAANKGFSAVLARTGFWVAGMVAVLSPALAFAGALYNRRQPSVGGTIKMTVLGALGGGLSGALIQAFYSAGFVLGLEPKSAIAELFRCGAWGLMGGTVGGLLARTVPNLARWRAACAGLVGGAIGCGGFLIVGSVLSDMPGRLLGVGVMGLAIGLSIVVAEKLAREASLEIIWAPNEITYANLGDCPVFIGGGKEDDVFVRGYPARHAGITLKQGRVEYLEGASGRQATLKNGSRMEIGKLTVVVHTD